MKTQRKQEYRIGIEMEGNTREAIRLISISLNRSRHRRNKKDRTKMRLFEEKVQIPSIAGSSANLFNYISPNHRDIFNPRK